MSVGGEFGRRVGDDELCAEVRQAVEGGDEDALRRLGFGGFGGYVQRLSELMSDSVREGHDPQAEDFAAIMEEVARPAHYAHHLVNEAGTAVQLAKDEPLGIHMKPQETDFDDDALKSTVGNAASMDTPEKTVEALAEGLAYAVKKIGNDFIKANAEAHSRAGFEVKVKRSGSTKCCPWCAARIGSWAIANAPDGVFGCHANCSCTVEYTSSTGAVSRREGTGRFVEVDYQPPHVMTYEEAREKGGFDEPKRLTGAANGGIIGYTEDNSTAGFTPAKTKEEAVRFARKFARSVNYDGITLLNMNQINETLNYLTQKYPTLMLDEITNKSKAVMNANWHHLEIRGSKLGKTLSDEAAIFAKEQELRRTKLTALKEKYSDGAKIPWRVEREIEKYEKALKFKRYGVHSSYKNHVKAVTTHEYGHIIADQYFGMMNTRVANPNYDLNRRLEGMRRRWDEAFKKSRENGDIYNLSMYADENVYEFFAESFLAREMGEQLPDYVESLMKEVLDNGIM